MVDMVEARKRAKSKMSTATAAVEIPRENAGQVLLPGAPCAFEAIARHPCQPSWPDSAHRRVVDVVLGCYIDEVRVVSVGLHRAAVGKLDVSIFAGRVGVPAGTRIGDAVGVDPAALGGIPAGLPLSDPRKIPSSDSSQSAR